MKKSTLQPEIISTPRGGMKRVTKIKHSIDAVLAILS